MRNRTLVQISHDMGKRLERSRQPGISEQEKARILAELDLDVAEVHAKARVDAGDVMRRIERSAQDTSVGDTYMKAFCFEHDVEASRTTVFCHCTDEAGQNMIVQTTVPLIVGQQINLGSALAALFQKMGLWASRLRTEWEIK